VLRVSWEGTEGVDDNDRGGKARFLEFHDARTVLRSLCVFVGVAVFAPTVLAAPGVASGSMELVCIPPVGMDMHLGGLPNNGTLLLHLWAIFLVEKNKPLYATATWCAAPDKCESAKGTVVFKRLKLEKKASGTYSIEFSDRHKEEGAFSVTRRQQEKPFICE
jgi:hypothetical protein